MVDLLRYSKWEILRPDIQTKDLKSIFHNSGLHQLNVHEGDSLWKHSVVSRKPRKQQEQPIISGLDSARPTEGFYGKSFPSISLQHVSVNMCIVLGS